MRITLVVKQIFLVIQWGILSLTPLPPLPLPEYSDDTTDRDDGYFETSKFLKIWKWTMMMRRRRWKGEEVLGLHLGMFPEEETSRLAHITMGHLRQCLPWYITLANCEEESVPFLFNAPGKSHSQAGWLDHLNSGRQVTQLPICITIITLLMHIRNNSLCIGPFQAMSQLVCFSDPKSLNIKYFAPFRRKQ